MAGNKQRKNLNVTKDQATWLEEQEEELEVSQSFLMRRALAFYIKEGQDKDQFLRAKTKGDV